MKKWLQYIIISGVALLIVLGVMLGQDAFKHSGEELLKNLCDAFFVAGVVILGFGLLIWSANQGTFDMVAFGVIKLVDLLKRDLTKVKYRTYYDYRQAQQGKKHSFAAYLIVGSVIMAISIVVLVLYSNY